MARPTTPSLPRSMTPAEQSRFRRYFPGLNVNAAVVTDNTTRVYNCIAWTVGVTNQWLWPGNTLAQFDAFYRGFGLARCSNGPIAVWGLSPSRMTHGSIRGSGHGPRWESKCGGDLRIQHGLGELAGSSYGHVVAFYCKHRTLESPFDAVLTEQDAMKEKALKPYLSAAQRKALAEAARDLPVDVREAFERAFCAWKDTWFSDPLSISSDPSDRATGKEFQDLIALGPAIIPLVLEKLADPENFMALQLYDALQTDANLLVYIAPDDERILEGEQGRARRTILSWLANR